ncbi:MAG: type II and III secretion system protein [Candidatus Cloacimonadales bacterium]|jgi:type IV pilus assembly protein PilQ|nr:type II and III secretion system protein [Candidatus Cloacimonadota bacterium]MDD2650771.1 type II and III secretion system protein [Candidatus Cloacimonadota bacterium]MDX9976729.1 type II and III secretion system protein [Candidatus Cloacimonadales bacterium]
MKKSIALLVVFYFILLSLYGQKQTDLNSYITIQRGTNFNTALKIIETLSYQYESKKIVNSSSFTGATLIPINQLHWKEALELLCQTQKLKLNEKGGVFYILDQSVDEKPVETNLRPSEKQVKITAIFFRADKDFFNSVGVNWQTLFNGKVLANIDFKGGNNVASDLISASGSYQISQNDYVIDLASMLRFVESNQKGSVIAHPNISVLSGKEGKIQVGQDFSIKKSDEAGNITDEFFSTGVILKVKPTIIQNDSINIIHLAASVEKSSATPGAISTIINKNEANTEVYLFDGEETVIGGLYDVEYTQQRGGIPFLKDLPWWVFGIKYLTGYNIYEQHNREMIVIIKAELYESIEQRMRNKIELQEKIEKFRDRPDDKIFDDKTFKIKEKKKN